MIELTRLNGTKFTLNSDLIETVDEVPDTQITLNNGKKFFVQETRVEIRNLVKDFKRSVFLGENI